MEYGRNLHRTSKESHAISKSSSSSSSTSSSSSSGSEGSDCHRLLKPVPVIRVVHIFNPTVIKTDAANFRSLVQELTGRSCTVKKAGRKQRYVPPTQPDMMVPSQKPSSGTVSKRNSMYIPKPDMMISSQKLCSGTVSKRNSMYIPERLGFTDIDLISSLQEPSGVMDLSSMLPSIEEMAEGSFHDTIPRFSSFYDSL